MLRDVKLQPSLVREVKIGEGRGLSSKLFVVSFPKGAIILEELKKITHINYTTVKWERFQPKHRDVLQCLNCLNFGHGAKHCAMSPRCAKCAGNHRSKQCTKEMGDVHTCANCMGDHSPYNRNCPSRKQYLQKRYSTQNAPRRLVPAPIPTRSSWAEPLPWVGQYRKDSVCTCHGCPVPGVNS